MKAAIYLCIACVCLFATGRTQDVSTVELPSEDEIYEAFLSGELEYDQFIQLLEVVQDGIDSSTVHLLDLIPNMLFFQPGDSAALDSELSRENAAATAHYSFYQSLQEPAQSRYSTSIKVAVGRQWNTSLKFRRDLNGVERITGRSATYHDSQGLIREVRIGSFSKQLGLGTIFGQHSKLMKCDQEFSGENLAFPDCSGQNGIYAKAILGNFSAEPIVSLHRDSAYSLISGGSGLSFSRDDLASSLIVGYTRLHNRRTGQSLSDCKAALKIAGGPKKNHWAIEYVAQSGYRNDFGTVVFEAVHRLSAVQLQATGWIYGDRYLDLTGGSKTASLSHTTDLPELGFSFTGKRSGQEGGLLRAQVDLSGNLGLSNSLLMAAYNQDTTMSQWLSELDFKSSRRLILSGSLLLKQSERALSHKTERRIRTGIRYASGALAWRTYLGHTSRDSSQNYFFWLSDLRVKLSPDTKIQLWSNVGRVVNGSVDYWYLFVRTEHSLFDQVRFSTKLMHRYDRTATHRRQLAIGLEVTAGL